MDVIEILEYLLSHWTSFTASEQEELTFLVDIIMVMSAAGFPLPPRQRYLLLQVKELFRND